MRPFVLLAGMCCLLGTMQLAAQPFSQQTVRSTSRQIDQYIVSHLQQKELTANPAIDDATFVRRAYINITGRIPTASEALTFIEDSSQDKHNTLIDTLIFSAGYKSRMFNFWADLLRVQTQLDKHGLGWHVWIRDAVEQNMPYDEFVNAMLSASGLATENPALGYYLRDRDMLLDNVSNTVQVFLGTEIGCAQCHDHPFDDWTQKQYYELAAFLGNTTYKSDAAGHVLRNLVRHGMEQDGLGGFEPGKKFKGIKKQHKAAGKEYYRDFAPLFKDFRRIAVTESPDKVLRLPKDYPYNDGNPGDILTPKTLFGDPIPDDIAHGQRRKAFANWVTSSDNPLFTKVIVNRLWAEVFGRGIVEPLDEWSDTTRVSHPELLDYLCEVMVATEYDVQQFMRVLYHTRLFASAVTCDEPERGKAFDFRGPVLRRMSAEEIHDSFLTLEFGSQDNIKNKTLTYRWQNYANSIERLMTMSMAELVELDENVDTLEEQTYALRTEARKLKLAAEQAQGEGDMEKARQLEQQAREKFMASKKAQKTGKDMMAATMMQGQMRTRKSPFLRASEQGSPAKPGSFMRRFGASDRMTPDASNTTASIPQALNLLNGEEVTKLTDGKGELAHALRQANTPGQRLDILFLSIYGGLPTESERQRLEPLTHDAAQLTALARAMINSKRFLFVQ